MKNETTTRKASTSSAFMVIQKTGTITFVSRPGAQEMAIPALMVFKK